MSLGCWGAHLPAKLAVAPSGHGSLSLGHAALLLAVLGRRRCRLGCLVCLGLGYASLLGGFVVSFAVGTLLPIPQLLR